MKCLLLIVSLLAYALFACEKSEFVTLDDLRSEAVVWQLDAYLFSPGSGQIVRLLDSERTLQFWEGRLQSNGDICNLSGPVGELQEIDYDPINSQFTIGPCTIDTSTYSITLPYSVNLEAGYLYIYLDRCTDGCSYRYRRKEF